MNEYEEEVAPEIAVPPPEETVDTYHWYDEGVLEKVTVKVTLSP